MAAKHTDIDRPKELLNEAKVLVEKLTSNTLDDEWLYLKIDNLNLEDGEAIVERLQINTDVTGLWIEWEKMSV
jgi:hypothetical protein